MIKLHQKLEYLDRLIRLDSNDRMTKSEHDIINDRINLVCDSIEEELGLNAIDKIV